VRRDDERADQLRALGAEVIVGDLTCAADIVDAMDGARRMFFNMSVSADYLLATAEVCAVALERGQLDAVVNMSQMTVSQMTLTSTGESHHQRLHWLAERILTWSGLPVVHVRPTVFLDNPLFTVLGARSIRERGVLALPFGDGHTSPIAAADVAPDGYLIIGAFAADGPTHCSGLPVARYGPDELVAALAPGFLPVATRREIHHTPTGAAQPFTWQVFSRSTHAPRRDGGR